MSSWTTVGHTETRFALDCPSTWTLTSTTFGVKRSSTGDSPVLTFTEVSARATTPSSLRSSGKETRGNASGCAASTRVTHGSGSISLRSWRTSDSARWRPCGRLSTISNTCRTCWTWASPGWRRLLETRVKETRVMRLAGQSGAATENPKLDWATAGKFTDSTILSVSNPDYKSRTWHNLWPFWWSTENVYDLIWTAHRSIASNNPHWTVTNMVLTFNCRSRVS